MRFHVYQEAASKQWRWRLWSSNNKILADSGESYVNKADCEHAVGLIKAGAATAPIVYS